MFSKFLFMLLLHHAIGLPALSKLAALSKIPKRGRSQSSSSTLLNRKLEANDKEDRNIEPGVPLTQAFASETRDMTVLPGAWSEKHVYLGETVDKEAVTDTTSVKPNLPQGPQESNALAEGFLDKVAKLAVENKASAILSEVKKKGSILNDNNQSANEDPHTTQYVRNSNLKGNASLSKGSNTTVDATAKQSAVNQVNSISTEAYGKEGYKEKSDNVSQPSEPHLSKQLLPLNRTKNSNQTRADVRGNSTSEGLTSRNSTNTRASATALSVQMLNRSHALAQKSDQSNKAQNDSEAQVPQLNTVSSAAITDAQKESTIKQTTKNDTILSEGKSIETV